MAEYVLQDKDKAAFINRMNKVLSQIGDSYGVDDTSFVDVPENEDEDKCIYIAGSPVEEKVVDSMIDQKVFSYKVKKIDVNEILREIKKENG
jgi:predicted RNA-binding protein